MGSNGDDPWITHLIEQSFTDLTFENHPIATPAPIPTTIPPIAKSIGLFDPPISKKLRNLSLSLKFGNESLNCVE